MRETGYPVFGLNNILTHYIVVFKRKKPAVLRLRAGAAARIRTGDLILTKDALYLLSYSSITFPTAYAVGSGDREGT